METETITLKAVTSVVTEAGMFEAVISTATIDREKDIVEPQAMVDALLKWVPLGKKVALRWNHGTTPDHVIGHIEPDSARVLDGEVAVKGWVDRETPLGKDAWRLIKAGVLGFSFGYLIPEGGFTPREGGGKHIKAMDVYEVTAFHAVMNNDTRVIGWKSVAEQKEAAEQLEREVRESVVPDLPEPQPAPVEPEVDLASELQEVKAMLVQQGDQIAALTKKVEETDQGTKSRSVDPLRKQDDELALEIQSGGFNLRPMPKSPPPAKPPELKDLGELKRETRGLMLQVLSGMEEAGNEPL